ncbi:MAG TPA: group 1 truncated hemoglobin, partial [bacterium]|nr:group 1 truncated hemoglobin [bacterium]
MKKIVAAVALGLMLGGSMAFAADAAKAKPAAGAKAKPKEKSLYERLGGLPAISVVVDEFLNKLMQDPVITGNAKVADIAGKVPAAYIKFQITTQVCMVTGGPCKYTGKGMKEAHKDMGITEKEWDAMAADMKSVLDAHNVPAKEQ